MRYLVTGGAGFIGSHIVERLVEDGHFVRVLDNLSTGRRENLQAVASDIEFIEGDITELSIVEKAVRGIDVVFHQAALASVPRSVERPLDTHHACVTGTLHVLDAARRADVRRVVYAASSSAYGNQPQLPKHEGQLPEVLSPYAAAKLAGELYCQAFARCYRLETVCLRYFNVFGPRQDPNSPYAAVIPLFVSALLEGRRPTIFGDGQQSRDFTYVANVVTANLLAAEAANVSGRVYNVACGHSLSVLELLRKICRLLHVPCEPEFAPPRPGDVRDSWADIRAAARDLHYEPIVDFDTGLKQTVAYYVAEHARRTGTEDSASVAETSQRA